MPDIYNQRPPKADDDTSHGECDLVQRLAAGLAYRKLQVQSLQKVLEKGIDRNKYPTKNSKQKQHQNVFKAIRHNSPFEIPTQAASPEGKACLKRNLFAGLWKDSKEWAQ